MNALIKKVQSTTISYDKVFYNRWLKFYLHKGIPLAAADELAFLKSYELVN